MPELNGCVERTKWTWRYEFHGCRDLDYKDLVKLNRCIDAFAEDFNRVRLHGSLGGLNPERNLKIAA